MQELPGEIFWPIMMVIFFSIVLMIISDKRNKINDEINRIFHEESIKRANENFTYKHKERAIRSNGNGRKNQRIS